MDTSLPAFRWWVRLASYPDSSPESVLDVVVVYLFSLVRARVCPVFPTYSSQLIPKLTQWRPVEASPCSQYQISVKLTSSWQKQPPVPLINLTVPLMPAAYSQQYNEHCSSVTTVDVQIGPTYERFIQPATRRKYAENFPRTRYLHTVLLFSLKCIFSFDNDDIAKKFIHNIIQYKSYTFQSFLYEDHHLVIIVSWLVILVIFWVIMTS